MKGLHESNVLSDHGAGCTHTHLASNSSTYQVVGRLAWSSAWDAAPLRLKSQNATVARLCVAGWKVLGVHRWLHTAQNPVKGNPWQSRFAGEHAQVQAAAGRYLDRKVGSKGGGGKDCCTETDVAPLRSFES